MQFLSRCTTALLPLFWISVAAAQGTTPTDLPWDETPPEPTCSFGTPNLVVITGDIGEETITASCLYALWFDPWLLYEPGGGAFDPPYPTTTAPISAGQQFKEVGVSSVPGDECGDVCGGNPINIATLNKLQVETDYVGPGELPLAIVRYYNSIFAEVPANKGVFGQGWTAGFAERLTAIDYPDPAASPSKLEVVIQNASGQRFRIVSTDGGPFKTTDGVEVNFAYREADELFVWWDSGLEKVFHKSGDLLAVTHRNGEYLTLSYDETASASRIQTITHSSGATLTFVYDTSGRIRKITDPGNRDYEYFYDANGNLSHVHRPNEAGRPASKVIYHYEDGTRPSALTGLSYTDAGLSTGARFATWGYTGNGYATFSEHAAGAERYDIVPTAHPSVTQRRATNAHGKNTLHSFQIVGGRLRLIGEQRAEEPSGVTEYRDLTYDGAGRYDLVEDWEGNVTDYDYDAFGRVASITTAHGTVDARTTTYEWDRLWNRPRRITTALLDTVITLDAAGYPKEITQTNLAPYGVPAQTRKWTITSTPLSTQSSLVSRRVIDGPQPGNGDTTTLDYDTNGRLTTVTQYVSPTVSLVTSYSNYDVYGRVGKITYATGMTRELLYHPRGYVLEIRDTVGIDVRVTTMTYTRGGDIEKVTFSDGTSLEHFYDAARRLVKIVEDDGDTDAVDVKERRLQYDVGSNVIDEKIFRKKTAWVWDPNCNPYLPPFPECSPELQVVDDQTYWMRYGYDALDRLTSVTGLGRVDAFGYTSNNQLDLHTDGKSQNTAYQYNSHD